MSKFGNDDGSNSNGRKDDQTSLDQTSLNGFRLDSSQSSWLMDRLGALDEEDKISMSGAPQTKQEAQHYDDPNWQQDQQQGGYQDENADADDRVVVVPPEVFSQNKHLSEQGQRLGDGQIATDYDDDHSVTRDQSQEQYMSSDDGNQRGRQPGIVPGQPLPNQRPGHEHPQDRTQRHPHGQPQSQPQGQEGRQPHPGSHPGSRGLAPQGPGSQGVAGYQGQRPAGAAGGQHGGYQGQVSYQLTEQERARIAQMGQQNNEDPELLKQKIEELEKQLAEISQLTEEEKAGYVEGLIYRGVARVQQPVAADQRHEDFQDESQTQDDFYYDEHQGDGYGQQDPYHQIAQDQRAQDQRAQDQRAQEQRAQEQRMQELAELRQAGYDQGGYRDDYQREQSSQRHQDEQRGYVDDHQYDEYQQESEYSHGDVARGAGRQAEINEALPDERQRLSSEGQLQMEPDYSYQQRQDEERQHHNQALAEQQEHDHYEISAQQQLSQQEYGTLPQFLAPLPQEKKFRPTYLSILGSVCALAIVGGVAYNYLGNGVSDVIKGDLSGLGVSKVDKFADQVGDDNSARLGTEKEMAAPVKEAQIELAGVPSGLKQSFIVDPVVGVAGKDAAIDVKLPSGVALDAAFIVLRDLPAWAKLSNGRQMNGLWMVSASQVPTLKMAVPADKHGNFAFEVDLIVSAGETPITRKVLAEISSATGEAEVAVAARDPLSPQPEMIKPPKAVTNKGPLIIDQALEEKWLERGTRLLRAGDVSAARLAFSHLAEQGSGRAALAMGMTYDPNQPSSRIVSGLKPDRKRAKFWYQRALSLGNEAARSSLRQLEIEK